MCGRLNCPLVVTMFSVYSHFYANIIDLMLEKAS